MNDLQTLETTVLKANIMGGMNEYIKEQGDDDLWDIWIEVFPDECSEDELMEMAKCNSIWLDVVERFAYCCRTLGILR